MEGLYTREKHGVGHVWLVTFTQDPKKRPYKRHIPVKHDFTEWLPRLKPREDARASVLKGVERSQYQVWKMRELYGMSSEEVHDYRRGKYESLPELDRALMVRYLKVCRKAGHVFRKFECGEYGKENGHPHFHVVIYGPDLEGITAMLKKWTHGFTDPNPWTWTGRQKLEEQVFQNATAGAAAKYAAKYLVKGDGWEWNAATFARQHPYVLSAARPPLGEVWAQQNISPRIAQAYELSLQRYASLGSQAEALAGYEAQINAGSVKVDGWWYPLSRGFRNRIITAAGIPEDVQKRAGEFAVSVLEERTRLVLDGGTARADHDRVLAELAHAEQVREERYQKAQAERERQWNLMKVA